MLSATSSGSFGFSGSGFPVNVLQKRQCIAEAARTGADVAANHEGGRPSAPTFAHVRASSAGANRVEAVRLDDVLRLREVFIATKPDLQPIRLLYVCYHYKFSNK